MVDYFPDEAENSTTTGLKFRAADRQRATRVSQDAADPRAWMSRQIGGPSADSDWDAFFQALHENGVDNVVGGPSPAPLAGDPYGSMPQAKASNALVGLKQLTGHAGAGETAPPSSGDYLSPATRTSRAALDALGRAQGRKSVF